MNKVSCMEKIVYGAMAVTVVIWSPALLSYGLYKVAKNG